MCQALVQVSLEVVVQAAAALPVHQFVMDKAALAALY
jgi:hypothetical protein